MGKKRPGVMLYFNWRRPLALLSDQERGALLLAILDYAGEGTEPQFQERTLAFAWQAIRPQIDDDAARYAQVVEKRRAAVNQRWDSESRHKAADGRLGPGGTGRQVDIDKYC